MEFLIFIWSCANSLALDVQKANRFFDGEWELTESAAFIDHSLVLSGTSAAFRVSRLPSAHFSLSVSIQPPLSGTAKVGLWFARAFGAFGSGFAILLNLSVAQVEAEFRENGVAFGRFDRPVTGEVSVTIKVSEGVVTVSIVSGEKDLQLFEGENPLNGLEAWLSLTAESRESVVFDGFRVVLNRPSARQSSVSRLSNARTPLEVVRLIDNLTMLVNDLPDPELVADSVREGLVPITESWQRTAVKTLRSIRDMNAGIEDQLNATAVQFAELRGGIGADVYEMIQAIAEEVDPLYFSAVTNELGYNQQLRGARSAAFQFDRKEGMLLFCIVEGMAVFFYFLAPLCGCDEREVGEPEAFRKQSRR
jgi:hypothetical protein